MSAGNAYRLKWLQDAESRLDPAKLEVWRTVLERLPRATDYGLEIFLIGQVQKGATLEQLARFMPKPERRPVDRKLAAAGER